jgi:protein-tyrosine phosphatase
LLSVLDVPVSSAGARAVPGLRPCPTALFFGDHANRSDHASVPLEAGHVRSASLVLGAAREHRAAAIALVPNAQRKAFTLLQAARLAAWLADQGVKAPPELAGEERLRWWVDELDAVRGDAPRGDAQDDDLPDPHDGGVRHELVLPRLASAAETLAAVLA